MTQNIRPCASVIVLCGEIEIATRKIRAATCYANNDKVKTMLYGN